MKLYLMMFTRLKCWWFCLRWASYLGRYRSQVPQEGPGNASRGLLFSEGRGHSAVTSCQLQQVNVIHHAPVNEQNIELLAKLFSRHPSIHKLYLLVFYMWVNYLNGFFFYWKWYFFLMFVQGIVIHSEQWEYIILFRFSHLLFYFLWGGVQMISNIYFIQIFCSL